MRRSREGAWIEICKKVKWRYSKFVAPVRERGLKSVKQVRRIEVKISRSREGAWIEIEL